jgi:hypothetical protein
MNRIQYEEIYTDTEKTKKRKQYHFVLTRFAPVAACLIVGLLIWQPWGNSLIMRTEHAMPAAPMADSPLYAMPAAAPAPEAFDFEAAPEDMVIIADSDDSDMIGEPARGGRIFDDNLESDGTFNRLEPQDIEFLQEHIDGAYAEITITGELPELLEGYMLHAFGPWFEWDFVFEIPITDISPLLDELGNRVEFTITHNSQNTSSPYAMVFFSYEE